MKYAIVIAKGQQLKVKEGETLNVAKIAGKAKDKISFDQVLLVVDGKKVKLGKPTVKGTKVTGEIIDQIKDKKIRVAKFRAKSRYRKVMGHRQKLTKIKISKIKASSS